MSNESRPVHKITVPEILGQIFEHAVVNENASFSFEPFSNPYSLKATLRLASVTQTWRQVAIANSGLWTCFQLSSVCNAQENEDVMDNFEQFLERSSSRPLHLRVTLDRHWGDLYPKLVAILRRESHRITTLRLSADDIPANLLTPGMSVIKSLAVTTDPPFLGTISRNLTCLEVKCDTRYELYTIVKELPTLRRLDATVSFSHSRDPLQIVAGFRIAITQGTTTTLVMPLVRPALEVLTVYVEGALHMLTLPNLQSLRTGVSLEEFSAFVSRSGCRLTEFSVSHATDFELLDVLAGVRHLHIEVWNITAARLLFQTLATRTSRADRDQLATITVRVRDHSKNDCSPFVPILERYHNAHGAKLEKFDIFARSSTLGQLTEPLEKGRCPIRVNRYPATVQEPQTGKVTDESWNRPWEGHDTWTGSGRRTAEGNGRSWEGHYTWPGSGRRTAEGNGEEGI